MPDRRPENNPPLVSARHKIMEYLARRDHSEKELRRKLSRRYEQNEIEEAIAWAREHRWLPTTDEERVASSEKWRPSLDRRKKGIRWMNQKLAQIGLPRLQEDPEQERAKATALLQHRLKTFDLEARPVARELRLKLRRFLLSRGFEPEVVHETLRRLPEPSSETDEGLLDEARDEFTDKTDQ